MAQLKDLLVNGNSRFLSDVILGHDPTSALEAVTKQYADTFLKPTDTAGTSGTEGTSVLTLGNNIATGTAGNLTGVLELYDYFGVKNIIKPRTGTSHGGDCTFFLPTWLGTNATSLYLVGYAGSGGSSQGVGLSYRPVYINSRGQALAADIYPFFRMATSSYEPDITIDSTPATGTLCSGTMPYQMISALDQALTSRDQGVIIVDDAGLFALGEGYQHTFYSSGSNTQTFVTFGSEQSPSFKANLVIDFTTGDFYIKEVSSGSGTAMTVLTYGTSTWADFIAAYNNNAIVYCAVDGSSSFPGSKCMAFLAYYNPGDSAEFQYVRSVSSLSSSNKSDQVFIYKLTPNDSWTTTTRSLHGTITAGTAITVTPSGDNITVTHTDTSSQASVTNSGHTYIQSVTLDGMGHVTGLTSATESGGGSSDVVVIKTSDPSYGWQKSSSPPFGVLVQGALAPGKGAEIIALVETSHKTVEIVDDNLLFDWENTGKTKVYVVSQSNATAIQFWNDGALDTIPSELTVSSVDSFTMNIDSLQVNGTTLWIEPGETTWLAIKSAMQGGGFVAYCSNSNDLPASNPGKVFYVSQAHFTGSVLSASGTFVLSSVGNVLDDNVTKPGYEELKWTLSGTSAASAISLADATHTIVPFTIADSTSY